VTFLIWYVFCIDLCEEINKGYQMQIKLIKHLIIGVLFSLSSIANAGLIKEEFTIEITYSNYNLFNIGEQFTFNILFDEIYINSVNHPIVLTDSIFDLINETSDRMAILTNGATPTKSEGFSFRGFFPDAAPSLDFTQLILEPEFFKMILQYSTNENILSSTGRFHFYTEGNEYTQSNLIAAATEHWFNVISHSTERVEAVPEPSTLAIFALGMIGLASRRFKK
tara:strand:- start:332 stop:1003 length:672 start_codon:yes stop_codon:yes gene_type:complete